MKYFALVMLISFNCFSADNIFSKFFSFFKSGVYRSAEKINISTEEYRVQKIYSANSMEVNTIDDVRSQTVIVEAWDIKKNAQVLLLSPQGSQDFYEIKNLFYARSNDKSDLQHVMGQVYVSENGSVKKIPVSMFKDAQSVRFSIATRPNEVDMQVNIDRLAPLVESSLVEHLQSKLKRDGWKGMNIMYAYKINGQYFYELERDDGLRSKLMKLSEDGKLVNSGWEVVLTRNLQSHFYKDGQKMFDFTRGLQSNNPQFVVESVPVETAVQELDFKTFEFKSLLETKVAERSFTADYYIKTGAGRDLFITSLRHLNFEQHRVRQALAKDLDMNVEVEVKAMVIDSVIEVTYKAKMEYLAGGIFLTIYGKDQNDVLKIDMTDHYHPKIVKNDWKVKLFGRTFDKEFKNSADSYVKISQKLGVKPMSCKKLMGLL